MREFRTSPGVATLIAALVIGCAHPAAVLAPAPAVAPAPAPAARAAAMTAEAPPCDTRWTVPDEWIAPGAVVLLGEMHGTWEAPRMVGTFACQAAAKGRKVWIGLEIRETEQPRIDAFMAGGQERELLEGPHWQASYQDGRESAAVLELLRRARAMKQAGRDVTVFAFDQRGPTEDRDAEMARNVIAAHSRAPAEALFVVLSGNLHARTSVAIPRPMGWRLAQAGLKPRSLDLLSGPGAAWYCDELSGPSAPMGPPLHRSCGPKPVGGKDLGPLPQLLPPELGQRGYDGNLYMGPVTRAAPPARADLFPTPATVPASSRAPRRWRSPSRTRPAVGSAGCRPSRAR